MKLGESQQLSHERDWSFATNDTEDTLTRALFFHETGDNDKAQHIGVTESYF